MCFAFVCPSLLCLKATFFMLQTVLVVAMLAVTFLRNLSFEYYMNCNKNIVHAAVE
jgi:hypothetical protein